jgi:[ribosomal protein S5]-alanine N-acetyltransferase
VLTLRSQRMHLRPLTPEDATPAYAAWLNDPQVNRYLEVRYHAHTVESCRDFIAQMNAAADQHLFGIFLASGQHIGNIKLGFIDRRNLSGQASLFIGEKAAWGKGYATEAIGLLTAHGFTDIGLERIEAGIYEENLGSLKAFLRAGYTVEGFFRKRYAAQDKRMGSFWLGILKDEWQRSRG